MRFNYLIRTMNSWLARVAYQPRDLEEKLARSGFHRNLWGSIALGTARLGLWMARWILHGLITLGHAISCFSLRQMEFDADLYEAKVSGSAEFTSVMKRLRFLSAGWNAADYLVARNWEERRLARDLPALTLARTEAVIEYQKRDLEEQAARERSDWLRTHPSERERIEHVSRAAVSPALVDSRPARELFRNFTVLSQEVTLGYYRLLGLPLDDATLCDVEEICDGRALGPSKLVAVRTFFANRLSPLRPLLFGPDKVAESLSSILLVAQRDRNLEEWKSALETSQKACDAFRDSRNRFVAAEQALWLKNAGIRFRPANFLVAGRSREKIAHSRAQALTTLAEVDPALRRFENIAKRRVIDGLRLAISIRPDEKPRILELATALAACGPIFGLVSKLRDNFAIYAMLYSQKKAQAPRYRAYTLRLELSQTLNSQLNALNPVLNALVPPYGDRSPLLAQLQKRLADDPLAFETKVLRDVSVYLEEIDVVYFRLIGDLCLAAQKAEASVLAPDSGWRAKS